MTFAVHYALALACFLASLRPSMLGVVIRVSWLTRAAISSFFVATGVVQLCVAVGVGSTHLMTALNAFRIVAVVTMMVSMFLDQHRVVRRMANALRAIRDEYDGLAVVPGKEGRDMLAQKTAEPLSVGRRVAATVTWALLGRDDEPPGPDVLA